MVLFSIRKTFLTFVLSVISFAASAQATQTDGDLYQLDLKTNQYVALNRKCSVKVGAVTTELDTEHGSPRQVFYFPYRLIGFPKDVGDYSDNVARGMAYDPVRSAQATFEPGFIGGFIGESVDINFSLPTVTVAEFMKNPQVTAVRAIYHNPTKAYFGFSDVQWAYDCVFNSK